MRLMDWNNFKNKIIRWSPIPAAIVLISLLFSCGEKPRDFYVVVDVSGSMAEGKISTMERVQESLDELLKSMEGGDRVNIITFADEPEKIGSFILESGEDTQKIADAVKKLKPTGRYTDMKAMLEKLALEARSSASSDYSRQYMIVLSDGKDDPPPSRKGKVVDLEKFRSTEDVPVVERYVYYISLGDGADIGLQSGLQELSGKDSVQVIEGKNGSDGTGIGQVAEDIQGREREAFIQKMMPYAKWAGMGLGGLLGLLLLFWLLRRITRGPTLDGKITYYESASPSMKFDYTLRKIRKDRLTIGSRPGVNLKVKELGIPGMIMFKSIRRGGVVSLKPVGRSTKLVKMLTNEGNRYVEPGDSFRIGKFIFEYNNGPKKK